MKRSAKSQRACWWFLPKLSRYSLTLLLSAVLLADAVGATPRNRGLQIAQQPEITQQITTHFAAEGVYLEGLGKRAIIGSDDRIPMTSRDYPWSAIGKIEGIGADGGGYSCKGIKD